MWRALFIAALGAALLVTPARAQRGGHGGMSAGGGRGGSTSHSGGGFSSHSGGGYGHRGAAGYGSGWNGNGRRGNDGHRSGWGGHGNRWHGNRWGWRRGSPWWSYGYAGGGWYPWWGGYGGSGWYDSSYDSYPADTYAAQTSSAQTYPAYVYVRPSGSPNYPQDDRTQQEIDRLNDEVDRLRTQQDAHTAQTSAPESSSQAQIHVETVLVYRDGHAEEAKNYAIVGMTIWVFNESHAKRIALSDLDLPATKRDNEDRGIEFVLPGASRQ